MLGSVELRPVSNTHPPDQNTLIRAIKEQL